MPSLKQIDAAQIDDIQTAVAEDGACIALNVLSEALCDELMADFQPHLDDMPWGTDELGYRDNFYGQQTKRLHGLFSKSAKMQEVLTHPLFLTLARRMFVAPKIARLISPIGVATRSQ